MENRQEEMETLSQDGEEIFLIFDYAQSLLVNQSPSLKLDGFTTPKKRGRKPNSVKIQEEIEAGVKSTLDGKFKVSKRITRNEKGIPCSQ